MKFFTVFIIAIVFVFSGFIMLDDIGCTLPDDERAVNEVLSKAAEFFKKKYRLHPVARNIAMPGGNLKLMGLDFQIFKPMQRKEIRKLLLEISDEFLGTINSNEKMKAMFSQLPLNIENIDLTIFFRDEDGSELSDPNIGIASISRGKLEYLTLKTKGDTIYVKGEFIESYEEARKLINQ